VERKQAPNNQSNMLCNTYNKNNVALYHNYLSSEYFRSISWNNQTVDMDASKELAGWWDTRFENYACSRKRSIIIFSLIGFIVYCQAG